jgi:uncharacterized protein (DUF58 family)
VHRQAIGLDRSAESAWRRWVRWLRLPRTLKVTPAGRTFIVVTLGIGVGAINTGNNLLYLVLGMLLSLVVASGILSERVLRDLEVRRIGAESAFAGEPFPYRWAVRKPRGSAFALRLSEDNPDVEGEGLIAHLPRGAEVSIRGDLVCRRRGPHHLSGVRVTTDFPLGLFAKTRVFPVEGTLLVYPRRVSGSAGHERALDAPEGGAANAGRAGGTGEVMALAPLREGDDARRIHWLRSASLGQLVRIEREHEERHTYLLRASARGAPDAVERACETVAAEARLLLARGHEVGLDADALRLRPAAGAVQEKRILSALAMLGFEERA